MKQKRNTSTLIVIALLLALLSMVAVSGTYAKYTTTASSKGQAIVAKWNFAAKVGENTITNDYTINLADYCETGLVTVSGVKKIQPGSKGTITVTVDNSNSDVAANITATATKANGATLDENQFEVKVQDGSPTSVAAGATAEVKIDWEWKYETTDDSKDTTVGNNAADTAIDLINLSITGTQVNPSSGT